MSAKGADTGSKRLISLAPDAWVRWLLHDERVEVVDFLSADFQYVSRETDALLKVRRPDMGEFLVLNELQLHYQDRMPRRMRAYAALAEERYDLPVYPVLVNILQPSASKPIPRQYHSEFLGQVAHQDYHVINLWEVDAGQILAEKLMPLLPFLPIMRGGRDEQLLQSALMLLRRDPVLLELESLLAYFASFVLDIPLVQKLMRWDMAVVTQSPWYQEAFKQGEQQGLEKGRHVMIETLLRTLTHRLGKVPQDIQQGLEKLTLDQLQTLFDAALDAESWAEFRAHLPATPSNGHD